MTPSKLEFREIDCLQQLLLAVAKTDKVVRFWTGSLDSPQFSYQDILERALRVAAGLRERGLRARERVAILLPTAIDFYDAYFGVLLAGGCPCALYPPVRLGRIDGWKSQTAVMLKEASCAAVITERRLMGLVGGPALKAAPSLGCFNVVELRQSQSSADPVIHSPSDLATIQFSSGSTGKPKAVALTHSNMLSNAKTIISLLPRSPVDHSAVSWLPLYHDMGLIGCLLSAMVAPGDLTLIRPEQFIARPLTWLEALSATKATISVAPNFAFGLCVQRLGPKDIESLDLRNWKVAMCGAEPVHPSTLKNFAQLLKPCQFSEAALTPVYGLAEATLAVSFSSFTERPRFVHLDRDALFQSRVIFTNQSESSLPLMSVGKALPGTEVVIRKDDEVLSDDCIGDIWVKGPSVSPGYLNEPLRNSESFQNSWLNTGDRGFIHKGELYLCGRTKDLIIIRGRNYDPSHIEKALDALSSVRSGCAVAFSITMPNHDSEQLVILAEHPKDSSPSEKAIEELRGVVLAETGLKPDVVEFLPPGTLPRTSSGKLRRSEASQQWQSGTLCRPGSSGLGVYVFESAKGYVDQWKLKRTQRRASLDQDGSE